MSHQYRLSVIIPVYNVENHIAKCLDSVLSQSDETVEIICVNDGSPDNSRQIISEYIEKNKNIKCIDRPNGGLSAARNSGLLAAQGEYIVLLDSDDWLEENVLSALYQQAKTNDLDVLIGNTKWIYPQKTHIEKQNSAEIISTVTNGTDALIKLMQAEIYVPMAYNYICKREFLIANNLNFKEGLIYEDELWTPQVLLKANRVSASGLYHYNYLQRENTITNTEGNQLKADSFFYVSKQILALSTIKNDTDLKECLWLRAAILYSRGMSMQKELNNDVKQEFKITWRDLRNAGLSNSGFNKCLGFLGYSKNQRRIIRLIHKTIGR